MATTELIKAETTAQTDTTIAEMARNLLVRRMVTFDLAEIDANHKDVSDWILEAREHLFERYEDVPERQIHMALTGAMALILYGEPSTNGQA
jgi:hypothetical protein